jgi:hypothetical protein
MLGSPSGAGPTERSNRLGLVVLVLLLSAWAVVLVPSFGFRKHKASAERGIRSFENFMGILANTRSSAGSVPGRWIMVPSGGSSAPVPRSRRNRLIRRRRQAFVRLLAIAAASGLLGLIPGLHALLLAHIAADLGVVAYVAYLRRLRGTEVSARSSRRALAPAAIVAAAPLSAPLSVPDRRISLDRISLDRIALDRRISLDRSDDYAQDLAVSG